MSTSYKCPNCSHIFEIQEKWVGSSTICPKCKRFIVIDKHPIHTTQDDEKNAQINDATITTYVGTENDWEGCGGCFVCIICIVLILRLISCISSGESDYSSRVWRFTEFVVTSELKSPGTAKFDSNGWKKVKKIDETTYEIASYVDAQNSFGALIRTYFTLTVKVEDGGDKFRVIEKQYY